jgi:predicted amidophosphoribosyltransferase
MKRWYNSSEVLCKYFSDISKVKYEKNIIKKIKNTEQQSKLSREKRLLNLKRAFQINKRKIKDIKDKNVIIIDDVISTWTTLNEASKILKENGAKFITWLIIASG